MTLGPLLPDGRQRRPDGQRQQLHDEPDAHRQPGAAARAGLRRPPGVPRLGPVSRPVVPPGWPEEVRPPGTPEWERTATAWLFDLCPPDYRGARGAAAAPGRAGRFAAHHVTPASRRPGRAGDHPGRPARRGRHRDRRGRPGRVRAGGRPPGPAPARGVASSRRRCAGGGSAPGCEPACPGRRTPRGSGPSSGDRRLGTSTDTAAGRARGAPRGPAGLDPRTSGPAPRSTAEQLDALAEEIRDVPGRVGLAHRRPPRPEPRRRRAHPGAAPGVRLAARPDPLGHRPPGLRAQDRHRPGRPVRDPAAEGRPVRLPEPGRVRARRHRELARVDRAVLRRRSGQGVPAARRDRPARRRRGRRRVAHRRHGLGGAEQHRRRPQPSAGHRRQRQRAVLRADHRRPGPPPRDAAHHPRLRAVPRVGQAGPRPHAGRRGRRSTRRCTA